MISTFFKFFEDANNRKKTIVDLQEKDVIKSMKQISQNKKKKILGIAHPTIIAAMCDTIANTEGLARNKTFIKCQANKQERFQNNYFLDFSTIIGNVVELPQGFGKLILSTDSKINKAFKNEQIMVEGKVELQEESTFGDKVIEQFMNFIQPEENLFTYYDLSSTELKIVFESLFQRIKQEPTIAASKNRDIQSLFFTILILFFNQLSKTLCCISKPDHKTIIVERNSSSGKNSNSTEAESECDHLSAQSESVHLNLTPETSTVSTITTPTKRKAANSIASTNSNTHPFTFTSNLSSQSEEGGDESDGVYIGELTVDFDNDYLLNSNDIEHRIQQIIDQHFPQQNTYVDTANQQGYFGGFNYNQNQSNFNFQGGYNGGASATSYDNNNYASNNSYSQNTNNGYANTNNGGVYRSHNPNYKGKNFNPNYNPNHKFNNGYYNNGSSYKKRNFANKSYQYNGYYKSQYNEGYTGNSYNSNFSKNYDVSASFVPQDLSNANNTSNNIQAEGGFFGHMSIFNKSPSERLQSDGDSNSNSQN